MRVKGQKAQYCTDCKVHGDNYHCDVGLQLINKLSTLKFQIQTQMFDLLPLCHVTSVVFKTCLSAEQQDVLSPCDMISNIEAGLC